MRYAGEPGAGFEDWVWLEIAREPLIDRVGTDHRQSKARIPHLPNKMRCVGGVHAQEYDAAVRRERKRGNYIGHVEVDIWACAINFEAMGDFEGQRVNR